MLLAAAPKSRDVSPCVYSTPTSKRVLNGRADQRERGPSGWDWKANDLMLLLQSQDGLGRRPNRDPTTDVTV